MAAVINLNDCAPQDGGQRRRCANLQTVMEALASRMRQNGLGNPELIADGKLHRCDLVDEAKGKLSGWYIIYPDGIPCAVYGSWKSGFNEKITGIDVDLSCTAQSRSISEADFAEMQQRLEAIKAEREAERQRRGEQATYNARQMYNAAGPARDDHPYLVAKGIKARSDIRETSTGELLVPLYHAGSQDLYSVQRILPNGTKMFLAGMIKEGAFGWLDGGTGSTDTVLICEGWATACSLHMATHKTVFFALDCGNLRHVGPMVRQSYPDAKIIICADDDRWTHDAKGNQVNPGLDAARKLAPQINAQVVSPRFNNLEGQPTDFNDLAQRQGEAEVRNQVLPQSSVPVITSWGMDNFEDKAPEQKWLADGLLPLSVPTVLAAAGGVGKGLLALDLGLRVAQKSSTIDLSGDDTWLGSRILSHGSAVILTAEDSKDDIHRRLESLDPDGSRRRGARGRLYVVPLPNAGGPMALVRAKGGFDQGYEATEVYDAILEQLKAIPDLRLINIDPLASFVAVDINSNPQAAQFTQGLFARLATTTGATVLTAHHVGKSPAKSGDAIEAARAAVRGSTAIVDGVRGVIGIWACQDEQVIRDCEKAMGQGNIRRSDVFQCALVKANYKSDHVIRTLLRDKNGLLKAVNFAVDDARRMTKPEALNALVEAIQLHAQNGSPYTRKGSTSGVYARRSELPLDLKGYGSRRLESLIDQLLLEGRIVTCTYGKSIGKYLDVPGGPFTTGTGIIESGATITAEDTKTLENVDYLPF